MQKKALIGILAGGVAVAAVLAMGCSSASTSSGLATVRVSVGRADAVSSMAVATSNASTSGFVDLGSVDALTTTLDSVQLQTAASGQWQTIVPGAPLPLNLLDLSTPIDLGTTTLETGSCEARLFVSDNPDVSAQAITFNTTVVVGQHTFDANTPYSFRIPSGPQTGLKADGTCQIPDGGTNVELAFDAGATVGTIAATGSGSILLTPVIRVRQP